MDKIDIGYTSIDNDDLHKKILDSVEGKGFVWAIKSMGTWVALYPIIIDSKDAFLIRTNSGGKGSLEIADTFRLVNIIIKRESFGAQWLDDDQIKRVTELLHDIEKIDLSEVFV